MSIFTKVCAGLLISTMSLAAHAAQPGTTGETPVQEPGDITVEAGNSTEVIQVLHVGVQSEIKIIDLVKDRNPDASLQSFIDQLTQDVTELSRRLDELAASKGVELAPQQMTENAKMIEAQMAQEIQSLIQKSDAEFRPALIEALRNKYEQALQLYTEVEKANTDEALKAVISEFRPVTQKHLDDLKQIELGTTEPTQPMQPSQPTE